MGYYYAKGAAGGGGAPTFDREDHRSAVLGSSGTTAINVSTTIAAGKRAVLMVRTGLNVGLSSVTDSAGNTWALDRIYTRSSHSEYAIASAHIANALVGGVATITATWGVAAYSYKDWILCQLSNVASSGAVDVTAAGEAFSSSVSTSVTTTATNTCVMGFTGANGTPTYVPATFSIIGAPQDSGDGNRLHWLKLDASSAGVKTPAGDFGGSVGWGCALVAYK